MAYSPHRNGSCGSPKAVRQERPVQLVSGAKQGGNVSAQNACSTLISNKKGHRRSSSLKNNGKDDSGVIGRVRVAVRLRPRNAEEAIVDADFGDCVELEPELKRLKLRKNNWDSETFQFDEVLTETSSQKRVYEVVAKPVVESVLEGYNGTVMAYGQTGTGKTYTLGKLGEDDTSDRGIMVRAMEEILSKTLSEQDSISMSYLQLYMETVQDLLAPEKDNIQIVEDPKTGDVSLPGATIVELRDQSVFIELLKLGEANRIAANTKMNTESSRSHAILSVNVRKIVQTKDDSVPNDIGGGVQTAKLQRIRRSKLLIVDLAGSERINKSGSDGHLLEEAKFINLSLTALGKCINALAENSPHVPIRDSKLTRLLRDSFGGTARTSLIITVGPSPQHRAESASTIMFGQRAMKVENMVKLKEEFDYKSLCRKLEMELDRLIAENEHQAQAVLEAEEELERSMEEARNSVMEVEMKLSSKIEEMEKEKQRLQKEQMDIVQKLEQEHSLREKMENRLRDNATNLQNQEKQIQSERAKRQQEVEDMMKKNQEDIVGLVNKLHAERVQRENLEKKLQEATQNFAKEKDKAETIEPAVILDLRKQVEAECRLREQAEIEIQNLKAQTTNDHSEENENKMQTLEKKLEEQRNQQKELQEEIKNLKQQLSQLSSEIEKRRNFERQGSGISFAESDMGLQKHSHVKEPLSGQRGTISKLFEQVGLPKIFSLLESDDLSVRVHALKVVANLAAEESNQEKIVEVGGLTSLITLLKNSKDEMIRRVAAGAIANLAMNETNQELVMQQGGIKLLSITADEAVDPLTLHMVAGAIANLCGNDKFQVKLREEGGVKALLGMVKSGHKDVMSQVARGIANFAKCESRSIAQGQKNDKSLLIEDGALPWIVKNVKNDTSQIRRHSELALCHLAQHEANAKDLVSAGGLQELVRISKECTREDIRNLAMKNLQDSQIFKLELEKLHIA